MSRIPDRVRQLVVEWPEETPRGEIDAFCRRYGVSRSWFHAVRRKARAEGAAALVKGSTRPLSMPTAAPAGTVAVVIATRHRLVEEGKDYGPRSILDVLDRSGFRPLPSRSTIARILDREQLVERNKRKRPKRSHQRIRSEYPNQRWQSDGFEVTLATGEVVVVIEIIDDCTRFNLALHPGPAETSVVVVEAFRLTIQAYGRPVLAHTDNGSAFNMERTGKVTELQVFLGDLGVKMITGRPRHPQSQGKVERAHQTILRFIAARNPATIDELKPVLEEYRDWYNHHRSHQALSPRTAPADLYETLPKVAPPGDPISPYSPSTRLRKPIARAKRYNEPIQQRTAHRGGRFTYLGIRYLLGNDWEGQTLTTLRHEDRLDFFDSRGEFVATTPWPATVPELSLYPQIDHSPPPIEKSTMS